MSDPIEAALAAAPAAEAVAPTSAKPPAGRDPQVIVMDILAEIADMFGYPSPLVDYIAELAASSKPKP